MSLLARSLRGLLPVSVRSIPAPCGVEVSLRSKRNVVLNSLSHTPYLFDKICQVTAVLDEIDLRAVDHEKRGFVVSVKVVAKSFRQTLQVLRGDAALELAVALLDASEQHVRS